VLPFGVQRGGTNHFIPDLPPTGSFASSRLPPPFQSGQGGLNTSIMKGLTATRSRLPPNGTKPDRSCVHASSRVLTSKIRDRPQSNTLDEPLGGRKRGPGRVMGLGCVCLGCSNYGDRIDCKKRKPYSITFTVKSDQIIDSILVSNNSKFRGGNES
jgi:hypothetical protein